MVVLSQYYPGITIQCTNCHALLGIDPHKDIYDSKYVYCPLCKEKVLLPLYEGEWHYANEQKKNI